jgi:hypothetical protein
MIGCVKTVNGNGNQGAYSQHFIFFVTYEWAQQHRAFHHSRPETLATDIVTYKQAQ